MEIFTDTEKHILEATYKRYKWIARDKDRELYIYEEKPSKNEVEGAFWYGSWQSGYIQQVCF